MRRARLKVSIAYALKRVTGDLAAPSQIPHGAHCRAFLNACRRQDIIKERSPIRAASGCGSFLRHFAGISSVALAVSKPAMTPSSIRGSRTDSL